MRSKFFGFSAKLALMLIAICGIFASCYEKEEIDVPTPSQEKPVYLIKGIVTAMDGAALAGADVNGTKTAADGTYSTTAVEGLNVVTISKADYETVKTTVFVAKIANGETAVYTVNARLELGKTEKPEGVVTYNIEGTVTDEAGESVTIETIYIAGTVAPTKEGNTFKTINVVPGTYTAYVTAKGYNPSTATIYVTPVASEKDRTITVKVGMIMQKTADKADPIYYVQGNVFNAKGDGINGATVKISTKPVAGSGIAFNSTAQTKGGFYLFTIEAKHIKAATIATININQPKYRPYASSFLIAPITSGSSSVVAITCSLKDIKEGTTPDEDQSVGGSGTAEVPTEDAKIEEIKPKDPVAGATKEEVEKAVENIMSKEDIDKAEVKPAEVAEIIQKMKEEGKIGNVENIAVVKMETPKTIEISSTVVTGEGTNVGTKEEVDQIVLSGNIVYATGKAENITLSRDIATEKATAGTRVYSGEPSGTIFTTPLKITFQSPVAITEKPDFDLGLLYEQKNGSWKAEAGSIAKFVNGGFVGIVKHFSKFKFGFESNIVASDSVDLPKVLLSKPCFTGAASQVVTVNAKYDGGMKYTNLTPALAVAKQLAGSNQSTILYITDMMTKMIKSANLNVLPENGYTKQNISVDMVIPAYAQVEGFELTCKEAKTIYTILVMKAGAKVATPVKVEVSKIISVKIAPKYTISHGHGHGHGDDLNAGGGIITFE